MFWIFGNFLLGESKATKSKCYCTRFHSNILAFVIRDQLPSISLMHIFHIQNEKYSQSHLYHLNKFTWQSSPPWSTLYKSQKCGHSYIYGNIAAITIWYIEQVMMCYLIHDSSYCEIFSCENHSTMHAMLQVNEDLFLQLAKSVVQWWLKSIMIIKLMCGQDSYASLNVGSSLNW